MACCWHGELSCVALTLLLPGLPTFTRKQEALSVTATSKSLLAPFPAYYDDRTSLCHKTAICTTALAYS